jgi:hypothetical protein
MQFLHPLITSPFFIPNILLSTMLSNTLSLYSSLHVRDQVSHPYRTTDKITVLHILILLHSSTVNKKTEGIHIITISQKL